MARPVRGAASSVDVAIDSASIDTQVADRDAHLRSADFLDVAKYPQITCRSKRVEIAIELEALKKVAAAPVAA